MAIYITGDTHRDFDHIAAFAEKMDTTKNDTMIVLGDAGINFFLDIRDVWKKESVEEIPLTFFCIHGNHEERPYNCIGYDEKEFHGGTVYYQEEYPSILFAKDGEVYDFDGYKCLVIGGAYSVDKNYRIRNGWQWFESEQPDDKIKADVEAAIQKNKIDVILSHTCPFSREPIEAFLAGIDQKTVDSSTEKWLDDIYRNVSDTLIKWYCGHFHIEKKDKDLRFMFNSVEIFDPRK